MKIDDIFLCNIKRDLPSCESFVRFYKCIWCTEWFEWYSGVIRLIFLMLDFETWCRDFIWSIFFLDYYLKDCQNLLIHISIRIFNSYYLIYIYRWIFLISIRSLNITSKIKLMFLIKKKASIFVSSKFLRLNPIMNPRVYYE